MIQLKLRVIMISSENPFDIIMLNQQVNHCCSAQYYKSASPHPILDIRVLTFLLTEKIITAD